ncbi:MAG: hypothetical protein ABIQ72_16055 [Usitatibacter sp.]
MSARSIIACTFATLAAAAPVANAAQSFANCQIFPADNYWNTRIEQLAVHPSSDAWITSMGATTRLHPDCCNVVGSPYGFEPQAVPAAQPLVPIDYYPNVPVAESDPGPYPIPPILAQGRFATTDDREVVVVENTNCILYELYGAPESGGARWIAGASAKWNLFSNALRPDGHQSGDQAGMPFMAGLLRWQEVAAGDIGHAIRVTSQHIWGIDAATQRMKYLWPARHGVGTSTDPNQPPAGARLRLKADFNLGGFDPHTQVILRAFKKYGLVLASGGGDWFLQGDDDPGWTDTVVSELRSIDGSNFEAVDTAPLQVFADSGQAVQPGPPDAPRALAAALGSGAAVFTFTPPYAPPSTIGGYTVTCNPGAISAQGQSSPVTVGGLAAGVSYTCSATASFDTGNGAASNTVTFSLGVGDDSFPPGSIPDGWFQPAGSSAPWVVANDAANAGSLSLKASASIAVGQASEVAYSAIFQAGNVGFARKVSSLAGTDTLVFLIDGIAQASWHGDTAWATVSFPMSSGTHALSWRLVKGSGGSASDGAWIDSVTLPAIGACRFPTAHGGCLTE